jgi:TonB family protein
VHFRSVRWVGAVALLGLVMATIVCPVSMIGQTELTRKVKIKVDPAYPDLARRMNVHGTVKFLVVVAPNGNVKDTKVMGGNPILVNAALDALKKWKFEPSEEESSGTVEFTFSPSE